MDRLSIVGDVLFIVHAEAKGPGLSKVRSTKHLPSGPSVPPGRDWSRLQHFGTHGLEESCHAQGLVCSSDSNLLNEVGRFPIIAKSEQII